VIELSGERATPEEALRLSEQHPLLHFAVHGFEGGFLQLAGEGGRLAARDVTHARLAHGTRVVLSACDAGAPGPGGIAWAFARAGATAVAAARGRIDDRAAAGWSERFYAAVAQGKPFSEAALAPEDRAARFIVVK
jgi:CHAT domain-containing protein